MQWLPKNLRKRLCQGSTEEKLKTLLADLHGNQETVYWQICSKPLTPHLIFIWVVCSIFWFIYWSIFCIWFFTSIDGWALSVEEWGLTVLVGGALQFWFIRFVMPSGYCCLNRAEQALYIYNRFGKLRHRLTTHSRYACRIQYMLNRPVPTRGKSKTYNWTFTLLWYPHPLAERERFQNEILRCVTEIPAKRLRSPLYREMRPQEVHIHRMFEEIVHELCRQLNVKPYP